MNEQEQAKRREIIDGHLDKFLAEHKPSVDGGYALVENNEVYALGVVIEAIVATKWGEDLDGDLPINWQLIDRTRYQYTPYEQVPYPHKTDDARKVIKPIMRNLRRAVYEAQMIFGQIEDDLDVFDLVEVLNRMHVLFPSQETPEESLIFAIGFYLDYWEHRHRQAAEEDGEVWQLRTDDNQP